MLTGFAFVTWGELALEGGGDAVSLSWWLASRRLCTLVSYRIVHLEIQGYIPERVRGRGRDGDGRSSASRRSRVVTVYIRAEAASAAGSSGTKRHGRTKARRAGGILARCRARSESAKIIRVDGPSLVVMERRVHASSSVAVGVAS